MIFHQYFLIMVWNGRSFGSDLESQRQGDQGCDRIELLAIPRLERKNRKNISGSKSAERSLLILGFAN